MAGWVGFRYVTDNSSECCACLFRIQTDTGRIVREMDRQFYVIFPVFWMGKITLLSHQPEEWPIDYTKSPYFTQTHTHTSRHIEFASVYCAWYLCRWVWVQVFGVSTLYVWVKTHLVICYAPSAFVSILAAGMNEAPCTELKVNAVTLSVWLYGPSL